VSPCSAADRRAAGSTDEYRTAAVPAARSA